MKITTPYIYQPLTRQLIDGRRMYFGDLMDTPLPSVTTILSATASKEHLSQWRDRIGDQKATEITEESAAVGEKMHKNLEDYMLYGTKPAGNLLIKMLTNLIISNGLVNMNELWGSEVPLYYPGLYAGATDGVGIHSMQQAIIDFKNSRKLKLKEYVEDYKLQVVAYALAHNALYGTNIRRGVIMIATWVGIYQEFIVSGSEFDRCEEAWYKRVRLFYEICDK